MITLFRLLFRLCGFFVGLYGLFVDLMFYLGGISGVVLGTFCLLVTIGYGCDLLLKFVFR